MTSRRICVQTREKIMAGATLFILILACYHLSRLQCLFLTLVFTLVFVGPKLIILIRRQIRLRITRVPRDTIRRWNRVASRIFHVIFTYYRLLTNFICSNKLTPIRINPKYNYIQKHSQVELPKDVIQLILQRLCISDYLRCGAVCLSWRAAVETAIASKCCPPAPQFPWLMLCSHTYSLKDHSFFSPSDQKVYKLNPANYLTRRHCVGSIDEWLLMVDSDFLRPEGFVNSHQWTSFYSHDLTNYTTVNYFVNPISGTRVMLPSQSTISCYGSGRPFFFKKLVASSVPTSPEPCLVASLCSGGRYLAVCRPTSKSWTLIHHEEGLLFHDIEIIDGKLYAATKKASEFLMLFDIQDSEANDALLGYKAEKLVMLHPRPLHSSSLNIKRNDGVVYFAKHDAIYIAKDPTLNELFLIIRRYSFAYEEDPIIPWSILGGNFVIPPKTEGFRVFKLEYCHNNGTQWVEVDELGDRILFMSKGSNKFISVDSTLGAGYKTVETNCIYFAFDYPCVTSSMTGLDFGIFSLTYNNIRPFHVFNDHSRFRLNTSTIWFTPNL